MTFLNPLLLLGALGIALPILAHLINRQQVKRTDWAAMQFLNRNVRVRSRQIRLRDLLLLMMRCLALLLIVFALARPATDKSGGGWLPGETSAGVVIAIDRSFSMAHREGQSSRFDRALEQARVIAEQLKPGDPFTLVMLGGEHEVVLRNVAFDADRFAEVLSEQQPGPESLDLGTVPKQLASLVQDMDAIHKEVYLITDTQAGDWAEPADALRAGLSELSSLAGVFVVPVLGSSDNLALTGLDLVSGELRREAVARYRATVQNFGDAPATNIEVRCLVDGVQIDSKQIGLIPAGGSASVSMFVPFYNAGPTRLTAEIGADSLLSDNARHAVAVVRDRVRVLCIDGSSGGAGQLLMAGLLARSNGKTDDDYQVQVVQWPTVPTESLDAFDVVILADVPEITPDQADAFSRFVREGNGLIWFAGENVKAEKWNALSGLGEDSLLPGLIGEVVDVTDRLGIGKPLSQDLPDHAVCRPLQSLPEDLLSETRFSKRLRVEASATSFGLLHLAGSHAPILLEHALGRGQVMMLTSSADTAWNNMALTPVFPMLMQQLVTYLSSRAFEQPHLVGDALTLSYADEPDASDAVFETPSSQSVPVPVLEHRQQYMALLERARESGFYVARVSVQSSGLPIAVNVDTSESQVRCLEASSLMQRLSGTGVTISSGADQLRADIATVRTGRSSWRYVLLAALLLLLAEALFADWTLRRKPAGAGVASARMEVA